MSGKWMSCSACRADLGFGAAHWVCSVSTCNRNRLRLVFCSVACWDSHVATLRHREAWAVEARAPSRAAWEAELASERATADAPAAPAAVAAPVAPRPSRVVVPPPAAPSAAAPARAASAAEDDHEILVVVSKMKAYVRERSGMSTSDAVAEVISEHVRRICDAAIRAAGAAGRKTVLDRDVPPAPPRSAR